MRLELLTVTVPKFSMPPPSEAELPDRVLPLIVSVPCWLLRMPPPPVATLLERVVPLTVSAPSRR